MQHKCFYQMDDLLFGYDNHIDAYAAFLQSGPIPPCLEDGFLQHLQSVENSENTEVQLTMYIHVKLFQEQEDGQIATASLQHTEKWMLICHQHADLEPSMDTQENIDWSLAAQSYPNLEEAPSFISQQRQAAGQHTFTTSADSHNLCTHSTAPL